MARAALLQVDYAWPLRRAASMKFARPVPGVNSISLFLEAAEQYSRALDIVVQNPNDYDPVWVSTFERRRDQALAKAKAPR